MASGRFSKQGSPFLVGRLNSNNNGDSVVGGLLSSAPSGLNISAWQQNLPGDRVIFSPADATLYSNNSVGNLFTGTYRYVGTNNGTSSPLLGHAGFWNCNNATGAGSAAQDGLYQVTSDEPANHAATLFAGVFINNITKTNWGWIQESGKTTCKFVATLTGTGAVGAAAYLNTGANNNVAADVGSFDVLDGANSAAIFAANSTTAYTKIGELLNRYVGPLEGAASNNNLALVDIILSRASFRW